MKKHIYLPQEELVALSVGVSEGMILNYILEANYWANSIDIDGEKWFQVNTGKIMADLPILSIKTKSWVLRKITTLISVWLIDKVVRNNKPYYKLTDKCRGVFFSSWEKGGVTVSQHNSNINYSKVNIDNKAVENIYTLYFSKIPKDKRKYNKSQTAKLYISKLLKEYTEEQLISSVKNYYRKTESKYIMACQYFFSDTKLWKVYRPFVDYIWETQKEIDLTDATPF